MHLVVLCGGRSAEREVSFLSAASILGQLDRNKYRISVLGIEKDGTLCTPGKTQEKLALGEDVRVEFPEGDHWVGVLLGLNPPAEVVFPVLHGPFGEDGTVQGALEVLDLPYVGAGVCGSALAMNKHQSKILFAAAGLPVLPHVAVTLAEWGRDERACLERLEQRLSHPVFVKPANMGSSVGINRSCSQEALGAHLGEAFRFDDLVIVEQGIAAREIEVSVLDNDEPVASLAGEIIPSGEFYTYQAKYLEEGSRLLIPAPLTPGQMEQVRDLALKGYRLLGLEGMARVDFLMEKESGRFWINEANTIPGFTQISMYPKLWEASGLSYEALLNRLIDLARERHSRRKNFCVDFSPGSGL